MSYSSSIVCVYLEDDIILTGISTEQHLNNIEEFLNNAGMCA